MRKWAAKITFDFKTIHLGRFLSEKDAAMAYDKAARRIQRQFAVLNFNKRKKLCQV